MVLEGGARPVLILSYAVEIPAAAARASLSPAERAVLEGMLRGQTNAELAGARRTALGTVAKQVASVLRKLGINSRSELAVLLAAEG
jgi:DNA-binding NarL/FixJ family response regulator